MEQGTATTPGLVILASGNGTNAEAVIRAVERGVLDAHVALVLTDRPGAGVIARAAAHGVRTAEAPRVEGESRHDYDRRLASIVAEAGPDLVLLLGWMRLLSRHFLDRFPGRVVNVHPARPGELPGTKAIERAFDEHLAGRRTSSGVMVHLVPDEGVDDGPVVATDHVPIHPDDTLESFAARVHDVEHRLVVAAVSDLLATSLVTNAAPVTTRS
jgi:phosphoribosylglycinamide formyltransferase 1